LVTINDTVNLSTLTASKLVFTDASKNLTSTGIGTSAQFIKGDGSLDSGVYALANNVLALDNTTAFTPDADYEPATKKYVDDNAGGTSDHSALSNLDYASAGHTGFEPKITAGTSAQFLKGDKSLDSSVYLTTGYVERSIGTSGDFDVATQLTDDNAYHDLDLSTIVPSGAKAVILEIQLYANTVGAYFYFRKNGNSNEGRIVVRYVSSGYGNYDMVIVPVDSNRIIEYKLSADTSVGSVTVSGWLL
jgi:hypothetical protein